MVEHYVANSVETKRKMGNIITKRIQSKATSTVVSQSAVVETNSMATTSTAVHVQDHPQSDPITMDVSTSNDSTAANFDLTFKDTFFGADVEPTRTTAGHNIDKYDTNFKDCEVSIKYINKMDRQRELLTSLYSRFVNFTVEL